MKWTDLPPWLQDLLAVLFMLVGAGCVLAVFVTLFGEPGNG